MAAMNVIACARGDEGADMTICIAVKAAEGLVLAADSMETVERTLHTWQGERRIGKTFAHANKIARFRSSPVGIMTWGLPGIGARPLQSLILEFSDTATASGDEVSEVGEELVAFLKAHYDREFAAPNAPELGVYVGGYSKGAYVSDSYVAVLPSAMRLTEIRPNLPDGAPDFGVNWYGQIVPLLRLIKGLDPLAINELIRRGASRHIVQQWLDDGVGQMPLLVDGMPLQDAIDLAAFLVQVTVGCSRFSPMTPACGGDVDIAVVMPGQFRWAARKPWALGGGDAN
jgi:hypothetical protein